MCIKTRLKYEKRRLLPNVSKTVVVLIVLFCLIGSAMAAGEPDPTPTTPPKDGDNFEIWDIFDKKEIVQAAKGAWSGGLADAGGNLLIGIAIVIALASILVGLLVGTGVTNIGKLGSDNDTHSKGKSMVGTAIGSAILLVLGTCLVVMVFSGWL